MLISFIVPVFNVEKKLLNACLESLKNIKRDDVEFIIVNDGSTNKDVCETFNAFKSDNRFNFINKNNSGVGDTRNLGISLAKGKYLFFVDGDDVFQFNELDKCINYLVEDKYDVITLNANSIDGKDKLVHKQVFGKNDNGTEFGIGLIWAKFIKKELLVQNNIKFNTTMKFLEDLKFMQDIFEHTDKYINVPDIIIYLHRVCIESTVSRYNPNVLQDFSHSLSLVKKENYNDTLRSAFWFLGHNIFPTYYYHKNCHLKNKKEKITEDLMNTNIFKDLYKADSSSFSLISKIQFFFFKHKKYYTVYIIDVIRRKIRKVY
jgi:glycosyltransferase involved in cell wall biosynthesis